jgi:hypothetical protein
MGNASGQRTFQCDEIFRISRAAGISQSWPEFVGSAISNGAMVQTRGGIVALRMGLDVPLPEGPCAIPDADDR